MRATSWIALTLLCGCSGLEMHTLMPDQVSDARTKKGPRLDGYVVYEPIVMVELSNVCVGDKDGAGQCKNPALVQCSAGKPFTMPNYAKPYLIASKNGLGKAGIDVTITQGWMLGEVKDETDNSAILGVLAKAGGLGANLVTASPNGTSASSGCSPPGPGLYVVDPSASAVKLTKIPIE